ncbi:Sodium/calcium exchanger protein-domain-containing protein [Radiomyces spectabilis]|uniref:Sodium/calcium exchanger protein-domain-containing protein n=1 Tax=Radiomyces spectabilis TaxID=64574 RepID=UPI00221E69F0|nr:Sodium/calcium exchanger protein-domain-containing protein [Radiomyces spectabilis]KAI8364672.1 Sodium/calcium exchanger protein-domain-containing protein [Radiomyces spectabilis]
MANKLVLLFLLGNLCIATLIIKRATAPSLGVFRHTSQCVDINQQEDRCTFVLENCNDFSRLYLRFYYCTTLWKPVAAAVLSSGLLLLFGAVSVVASDFFCPNLQTISSKLSLSESMAGVTLLAFGNGSPDLFSTFSAMNTGAGSLAIGELIGAAFFIVAIVSGCMGIIRPFKSKRITFMRDASFLTGAIVIMTWIVYQQRIHWYNGVTLIVYYLAYVSVVVFSTYPFSKPNMEDIEQKLPTEVVPNETSQLLGKHTTRPPRLSIPNDGFSYTNTEYSRHLGHIILPVSPKSTSPRPSLHIDTINVPRSTSTHGSLSARPQRHPMTPRIGIRTSLFSAIEFQEQISSIRRASSSNHYMHRDACQQQQYRRQRQRSMPQQMWKRSSQLVAPGVQRRRPRAFTTIDQLIAVTPEHCQSDNAHGTTGVAEDYFTYLSSHQLPARKGQLALPGIDVTIPEIILAPPTANENEVQRVYQRQEPQPSFLHESHPLPSPQYLGQTYASSNSAASQSLSKPFYSASSLIPPSTSFATSDYDIYVSARQSPEHSPSPSFQDCRYLSPLTLKSISAECSSLSQLSGSGHFLKEAYQILFPTLRHWKEKTLFSQLSSLIAMPLVLLFTLTLPVAEADDVKIDGVEVLDDDSLTPVPTADMPVMKGYLTVSPPQEEYTELPDTALDMEDENAQQGWCRWLLATQAIISMTFIFVVMAIHEFIDVNHIGIGLGLGTILAGLVLVFTKAEESPSWFWMVSFGGFFVALHWIFLLANEMVGLLQALGIILEISDAIMGLTVFALGNSIGDLVANTAIAKMGFPTMAISACYAGPLLNMVLGVGISSTYQTWTTGQSYTLDIAPTILVSCSGLIVVLISTLVVVSSNNYHINGSLGWWMIFVYFVCCTINFALEFNLFQCCT